MKELHIQTNGRTASDLEHMKQSGKAIAFEGIPVSCTCHLLLPLLMAGNIVARASEEMSNCDAVAPLYPPPNAKT
jgi:hypothetical protein